VKDLQLKIFEKVPFEDLAAREGVCGEKLKTESQAWERNPSESISHRIVFPHSLNKKHLIIVVLYRFLQRDTMGSESGFLPISNDQDPLRLLLRKLFLFLFWFGLSRFP
jgi:hypothetical protein